MTNRQADKEHKYTDYLGNEVKITTKLFSDLKSLASPTQEIIKRKKQEQELKKNICNCKHRAFFFLLFKPGLILCARFKYSSPRDLF